MNSEKESVCVIIGRFQVHELHDGHISLIKSAVDTYKKVILFLGVAPVPSKRNPLDFLTRKLMIEKHFPELTILPISDCDSNEDWSNEIDKRIDEIIKHESVVLLGSRDSFIPSYSGKYKVEEFETNIYTSGSEVRDSIKNSLLQSSEFRQGIIYGINHQYDIVFQTVDCVVYHFIKEKNKLEILLARKENEKEYRCIGGFVDIKDFRLENTLRREVIEETGIEISNPEYVMSMQIDDWRYRDSNNKIMTSLFLCNYVYGRPTPNDDICELRWFDCTHLLGKNNDLELSKFIQTNIVSIHRDLVETAIFHLGDKFINLKD